MTKVIKSASKKVLVTVPEPLLKRLDAKAHAENRTRSAELCVQLAKSLGKTRARAQA
ncbi:MAG: type II toxin-antitoxin system HicB family antitoxin [Gammaproteobacteria bacterium]|nr:type II toxin-antitoxin system HicB family antitoxin [Gammaproteobacteria bacterium]